MGSSPRKFELGNRAEGALELWQSLRSWVQPRVARWFILKTKNINLEKFWIGNIGKC
jgi:hypothetical protein